METVLLSALGGHAIHRPPARPPISLSALDDRVRFLHVNAIEKSTAKGYRTGARDYLSFCSNFNLPCEPTPENLARYIAYTSLYISSGPKYLSGARHFLQHVYPAFEENRASPLVQSVIRGSKKARADPVHRKLPLRLHHLETFANRASSTSGSYDDLLFITLLACGFYGCHRMGELLLSNDKDLFDWKKIIKRASLSFDGPRASYILPYHKGNPLYRGTLVTHNSHNVANPVALLLKFVLLRDKYHGARAPLFLKSDGSFPTRSWFERRLFTVVDRSFGAHSARAGGATYYAALGLSESTIQALGRWSSSAWKDYVRDNPAVRAELELAAIRNRI